MTYLFVLVQRWSRSCAAAALAAAVMVVPVYGQGAAGEPPTFLADESVSTMTPQIDGTIAAKVVTFPQATGASFTFTGDLTGNIGDGGTLTSGPLPPGSYVVNQQLPAGWGTRAVRCDDGDSYGWGWGSDAVAYYQLQDAEAVTCRFYNVQPAATGCREVEGRWPYGPVTALDLNGSLAYVASGAALSVVDVGNPASPTEVAAVGLPGTVTDVEEYNGYAYVAFGYGGSSPVVVDFNLPAPQVVGTVPSYGVMQFDMYGPYLVVVTYDRLEVFDLVDPTTPILVGSAALSSGQALAVSGSRAYAASSDSVLAYDLTSLSAPALLGGISLGYGVLDVAASGTFVFALTTEEALSAIDFTVPSAPAVLATRQLWYPPHSVTVQGSTVAVGYGSTLGVYTFNAAGANPLESVGSVWTVEDVRAVRLADTVAHVANSGEGLTEWSLPGGDPQPLGAWAPLPGGPEGFAVRGGDAFLALGYDGLVNLDVSDPSAPIRRWAGFDYLFDVEVRGDVAYLAGSGLQVVDVSDPAAPILVGFESLGLVDGLAVDGDRLIALSSWIYDYSGPGMWVVDVSDPASPNALGSVALAAAPFAAVASGRYVFVADGAAGLQVVDALDPASPVVVGGVASHGQAVDVLLDRETLYLADSWGGLRLLDVSNPLLPAEVGSLKISAVSLARFNGPLAVAAGAGSTVSLVDVSNRAAPIDFADLGQLPSGAMLVEASRGRLYVFEELTGVEVFTPCDLIFADDVETGTMEFWAATHP